MKPALKAATLLLALFATRPALAELPVIESFPEEAPKRQSPAPFFENKKIEPPARPSDEDEPPARAEKAPPKADLSEAREQPFTGCSPKLPNNAPLGASEAMRKASSSCLAAQNAQALAETAAQANRLLFCSDPAGAKAQCQASEDIRKNKFDVARARRDAALANGKKPPQSEPGGLFSYRVSQIGQDPSKTPTGLPDDFGIAPVPGAALLAQSRKDAQEKMVCAKWDKYNAALFPFMTAEIAGQAKADGKTCPAILYTVQVSSGRYAGNFVQAASVSAPCKPQILPSSSAQELAAALAGAEQADKWTKSLQAVWIGPAPARNARQDPQSCQNVSF